MDRGDGSPNHDDGEQNHVGVGLAVNELLLALLQQGNLRAVDRMFPWIEINQLRGLVDNQLPQQEEAVDVPVGGIEINPPQEIAGPWENFRAEMGVGDGIERNPPQEIEGPLVINGAEMGVGDNIERNPPQQIERPLVINRAEMGAGDYTERNPPLEIEQPVYNNVAEEDPIIDEIRWWEDEGSESDTESVPDSDTDDDGDNGQDAPVLLPPNPVPGGSRRRPREEEDEEEEDGRARKMSKH